MQPRAMGATGVCVSQVQDQISVSQAKRLNGFLMVGKPIVFDPSVWNLLLSLLGDREGQQKQTAVPSAWVQGPLQNKPRGLLKLFARV